MKASEDNKYCLQGDANFVNVKPVPERSEMQGESITPWVDRVPDGASLKEEFGAVIAEIQELRAALARRATAGNAAAPGELTDNDIECMWHEVCLKHLDLGDSAIPDFARSIERKVLASTAGAVPGKLNEAAAYRFWRDCMLAEDESFVEAIQREIPGWEPDMPPPNAATWDSAMFRVMHGRVAPSNTSPVGAKEKE